MNVEGMKRFEQMCEIYINGSEEVKALVLAYFDNEEDKKAFLTGCGLYRMFTDEHYYKAVQDAMADTMYKEFREEA